ncbi:class I SAM-dependent methyltransferase [Hymenobacter jeollabukensis]|uniref:Class I SAM-dependent methyltransferase n=1 Tax=Hymenobacter jeollabukensis TaxID=2025313 RepID=A0A5R8WP97_9BACT|nr:class I SAM-dependent methyltransferase [Hymenobacter jeollabukensis]TLM91242.1 class I SAM-dependent methyltransferase [Hymenobacter jeollabukensis]
MDHHALSIAAFDQLAQAYQDKFMDLDLYDDSYDRLAQLLPPSARVLELGCGPGNVTRALLRRRPDLHILATDPAPNMLRLTRQNNPAAECQLLDARAIGQLAPRQFEAVVAGFCLPYLAPAEGAQLLRDAHARLTPEGLLYLSFIDDEAARSGFEASSNGQATAYVYYHPAAEVRANLAAAGFALVEEFRKPYPRADRPADTHCILLARKQ